MGSSNCRVCGCNKETKENEEVRFTEIIKSVHNDDEEYKTHFRNKNRKEDSFMGEDDEDDDDAFKVKPLMFDQEYFQSKKEVLKVKSKSDVIDEDKEDKDEDDEEDSLTIRDEDNYVDENPFDEDLKKEEINIIPERQNNSIIKDDNEYREKNPQINIEDRIINPENMINNIKTKSQEINDKIENGSDEFAIIPEKLDNIEPINAEIKVENEEIKDKKEKAIKEVNNGSQNQLNEIDCIDKSEHQNQCEKCMDKYFIPDISPIINIDNTTNSSPPKEKSPFAHQEIKAFNKIELQKDDASHKGEVEIQQMVQRKKTRNENKNNQNANSSSDSATIINNTENFGNTSKTIYPNETTDLEKPIPQVSKYLSFNPSVPPLYKLTGSTKHSRSKNKEQKSQLNSSTSSDIGLNPILEKKINELIVKTSNNSSNQNSKHHKNTSSMITMPSPIDKEVQSIKDKNSLTRNPSQFSISQSITSYKGSFLELSHIQFGIENKEELTFDEKKLLEETQKNLNQFFPPQKSEMKNINKKLQQLQITSIIPETKISCDISNIPDTEIIFHGELNKMINYEINAHKPKMYSERFCTLYKKEFRYYKSRESLITRQKPLCVIPLSQIARISFAKWKKTDMQVDHIIISNKLGIYNKRKRSVFKMFDSAEKNAFLTLLGSSESLLIFTAQNVERIYEWYLLLNYFLDLNNTNEE